MTRWLGSILLVGVFLRHNSSFSLPGYSPQAWFYILGGLWEVVLCFLLLRFITIPLGIAALWIGILEGAQVSVCRLATQDITQIPKSANLCDILSGLPIGATMTALYLGIVCWAIGKEWRKREQG